MKLKFIHITKTGGTSIENAARAKGINWGRYDTDLKFLGKCYWHNPFQFCVKNKEKSRLIESFEFFAVVRHPYDRCVSEYFCRWGGPKENLKSKEQMNRYIKLKMHQIIRSGDRSLKSRHFVPQYRYFYDGKGNRFVNQVVKFDNLQEEFNRLMAQYDIPLVLDNHDNFSEKTLSVGDLDEDTKILIQRVYKRDFLEFGFDHK